MSSTAEREAVGRLLEEVPNLAAEMNNLRHDVDIFRAEQVDLRAAVITLQDAQEGLQTHVATLQVTAQDLRNDIAGLRASQGQLRYEMQTNSDQQRVVMAGALDDLRVVAASVVHLHSRDGTQTPQTAAMQPGVTAVSEDTSSSVDAAPRHIHTGC